MNHTRVSISRVLVHASSDQTHSAMHTKICAANAPPGVASSYDSWVWLHLLLILLFNISPRYPLQVAPESKKSGRKAIHGTTLKCAIAGDWGRVHSLLLMWVVFFCSCFLFFLFYFLFIYYFFVLFCFPAISIADQGLWISKLLWACTEMQKTLPGFCASSLTP